MGAHVSQKVEQIFFFSTKLRQKLWAEVGAVRRGVLEIKSLQVPGERTQSAERAKERRRDKRFPFKLIPLRPSRFPSQDSQKSDKNLALWIWQGTGRGGGEEERLFQGEKQKEQRGTMGERRRLRQIKGRWGRQVGWVHSPRAHLGIVVRQRARAISYQTHVPRLMMCSTYQLQPRSWQLKRWIASHWPEIRLWTRPVSLSTSCWGLKRTSAIRAAQAHHRPVWSPRGPHNKVVCVAFLSNSMDVFLLVQYEAATTRVHHHKKEENSTTYSFLCSQMSGLKPDENIFIPFTEMASKNYFHLIAGLFHIHDLKVLPVCSEWTEG